jgi:hypothetical protein
MGGIMNGLQQQEEPIFPRLETLSENLGQAEQTLGQPSNQSNISSITTAMNNHRSTTAKICRGWSFKYSINSSTKNGYGW